MDEDFEDTSDTELMEAVAAELADEGLSDIAPEKKKRKAKSKIDPAVGDRRKTSSKQNAEIARLKRMANLEKEKAKQEMKQAPMQYTLPESSDDDEYELRARKPQRMSASEARLLKMEFMLKQLALQQKAKPKAKKTVINVHQPAPATKTSTSQTKAIVRQFLDL